VAKEVIYVEFVGLEERFAPSYAQAIRQIICQQSTNQYRLCVWQSEVTELRLPDLSIVAVDVTNVWNSVKTLINKCHCLNIGLLGSDKPVLGFPPVRLLDDVTGLIALHRSADAGVALYEQPRVARAQFAQTYYPQAI
jgi:hypothetical protein